MDNKLRDLIQLAPEEVYGPDVDLSVFDEPEFQGSEHWVIGFASDFVVVGHNSENADMDNPTGAIIRERFYIVAEDAKGNRRTWGGLYDSLEAAEAAYAFLAPVVGLWEAMRPAYGSEAYAANWKKYAAEDLATERAAEMMSDVYTF